MTFNNSSTTLQDVKDKFIRRTSETTIVDNDVIDAVNDFYSIVKRAERQAKSKRSRLMATISITSSGYDLLTLPDIGSDFQSFFVYKTELKPQNMLPEVRPDSNQSGYYIMGDGKIYKTSAVDETTFVVLYEKVTPTVELTDDFETTTLLLDKDLEQTFRRYLRYVFYEGQYQVSLYEENEQKFVEELTRYFKMGSKARFFNTY